MATSGKRGGGDSGSSMAAAAASQWLAAAVAAGSCCSLAQAARRWLLCRGSSATERGQWLRRQLGCVVGVGGGSLAVERLQCSRSFLAADHWEAVGRVGLRSTSVCAEVRGPGRLDEGRQTRTRTALPSLRFVLGDRGGQGTKREKCVIAERGGSVVFAKRAHNPQPLHNNQLPVMSVLRS